MLGTRNAKILVSNYSTTVLNEEEFDISNKDPTYRAISTVLDESFRRSYDEVTELISQSPLITRATDYMKTHRLCGGFKPENASLGYLTSFEQMFAISEFLTQNPQLRKKTRTYALKFTDNQVVPVSIKIPYNGESSLLTTIVGTTTGQLRAQDYEKLAINDPYNVPGHEIFINPLTCLEMHRNPDHIGALALKSEAYDSGFINHEWRYQNYKENGNAHLSASAELKKQKSKATRELVAQSAGYNLAQLIATDYKNDCETNILATYNFENFVDEGYADDANNTITAKDIVATFPQAIKGNTEPLDNLTRTILATRLDCSAIGAVKKLTVNLLFPEASE